MVIGTLALISNLFFFVWFFVISGQRPRRGPEGMFFWPVVLALKPNQSKARFCATWLEAPRPRKPLFLAWAPQGWDPLDPWGLAWVPQGLAWGPKAWFAAFRSGLKLPRLSLKCPRPSWKCPRPGLRSPKPLRRPSLWSLAWGPWSLTPVTKLSSELPDVWNHSIYLARDLKFLVKLALINDFWVT